MSPLCAHQLERARQNFDGEIHLIEDYGDSILVVIVPAKRAVENDEDGDWGRITKASLLFMDPARCRDGSPQ